jgi:N-acetyl-gamma-glutamyl-phosphate reductase common form
MTRTATVIGGSGYVGGEVLRLLLSHPEVELRSVTAHESAGRRVDEVQPNLRGFTDLRFAAHEGAAPADVTFLALPNGTTGPFVPKSGKVVDLSGDFRLAERAAWEAGYGMTHPAWHLQREFVTGIPEIHRDRIRSARCVSVAGCFATCAILAIHPLSSRGLVAGRVIVDGKTGSSGSGARPSANTLHAFRRSSFFGYGMFQHRHQPEIEQATGVPVLFQPHSTPLVRGVFNTVYVPLKAPMETQALLALYEETYEGSPFVRLQQGSPNVSHTRGSNFADLGVQARGETAIVFGAIDNLVKGAAGQAVQCMNVMLGLDERAGLFAPAMVP